MRPLTFTRPKVMLPIVNRPILEHLLVEVREAGVEEFVFVVGYHDEKVRDYFEDGAQWGVSISYANQRRQSGTADALKAVKNLVDGNFLVINGDIIVGRKDISQLIQKGSTTMGVVKVEDTWGLGVVEISGDRITRIYEKVARPTSPMANSGLYLFTPEIFDAISQTAKSPRGEYEITSSLQLMIDNGHHVLYQELGHWLDLSYPWDLLRANETLLAGVKSQNLGEVEDNVVMKGEVSVGRGTIIRSGSYIMGPVIIGQGCDIGPNCFIRSGTAIGDACRIGNAVEVKNSIVMKGSKIPHHNYVGDSVIGEGCNLGAGTKIANLKLDKKSVVVGDVDTRRHKLGAILGDGVETGINASINVGCVIGNNALIGPGALAHGIILPNSKVF